MRGGGDPVGQAHRANLQRRKKMTVSLAARRSLGYQGHSHRVRSLCVLESVPPATLATEIVPCVFPGRLVYVGEWNLKAACGGGDVASGG